MKLFCSVQGLKRYHNKVPSLRTDIDCITSRRIITLPGLIDVHVHMREPGAAYKGTENIFKRPSLNIYLTTLAICKGITVGY